MGNIWRWGVLAALGLAAVSGAARGSESRLLVSVEVAPGVDVGPADVRRAVATELGTSVIASRDSSADGATDVLLVALDPREIRMSLRAGPAPIVSRAIAAPADRTGRLRSIGWLAGNLLRDQVGPIVGAREPAPPPAEERPATEPLPLSASPAAHEDTTGPDAVVAARLTNGGDEPAHATWMITAAGGPTLQMTFLGVDFATLAGGGGVYQVEVQHQTVPDSMLLGAAMEVGPSSDQGGMPHYLGVAGFAGSRWHSRRWFLEGTVGLGLEAVAGRFKTLTVTNNSSQTSAVSETKVSFEPGPGLYARLQGAGGVRVSRAFDLVAQIGAHLSSDWRSASFLSSTIGVRMRLP